jgi:hypothetical protein
MGRAVATASDAAAGRPGTLTQAFWPGLRPPERPALV